MRAYFFNGLPLCINVPLLTQFHEQDGREAGSVKLPHTESLLCLVRFAHVCFCGRVWLMGSVTGWSCKHRRWLGRVKVGIVVAAFAYVCMLLKIAHRIAQCCFRCSLVACCRGVAPLTWHAAVMIVSLLQLCVFYGASVHLLFAATECVLCVLFCRCFCCCVLVLTPSVLTRCRLRGRAERAESWVECKLSNVRVQSWKLSDVSCSNWELTELRVEVHVERTESSVEWP